MKPGRHLGPLSCRPPFTPSGKSLTLSGTVFPYAFHFLLGCFCTAQGGLLLSARPSANAEHDFLTVQVPASYKVAIAELAKLDADQRATLLKVLHDSTPSADMEKLAQALHKRVPLGQVEAQKTVAVLLNAYIEQDRTLTRETIAQQLVDNVPPGTTLEDSAKRSLANFFVEALSDEGGFGLSAKAFSVKSDHARNFVECRILTDIRPVFRPGQTSVMGYTIGHDLKLTVQERDRLHDMFVSCDESDLLELKGKIERAIEKSKASKDLLNNVQYVGG